MGINVHLHWHVSFVWLCFLAAVSAKLMGFFFSIVFDARFCEMFIIIYLYVSDCRIYRGIEASKHTHTHARTHVHTHIHTHTHTHTQRHAHTEARTHVHTHTHTLNKAYHAICCGSKTETKVDLNRFSASFASLFYYIIIIS